MPGLKIVVGPTPSGPPQPDSEHFAPDVPLERLEICTGPRLEITFEASAYHPRLTCSGPDFLFFLEGVVYDRSDDELEAFAALLARTALAGDSVEEAVRGFMTGTDGEYVFVLVLEGGARVMVFTDPWGRLPLYAAQSPSLFLLGREPQDLLPHLSEIRLNRQAIAEWLSFEYTLNPEWFVQGIAQVPPGTWFDVSVRDGDVLVTRAVLQRQDFTVAEPVRDRRERVRRYAELYLEGYATRVARLAGLGYRLTADLSGGFDTRAVFAGARRLDAPIEFYTDELVTGDESEVAMRLAEAGGVPVARVAQGPAIAGEAEWRRLVYLTGGRVKYDTMLGAVLVARERRRAIQGPAARFMGFGGELVRRPYVRPYGYRNFQEALGDDVYTRIIRIGDGSRLVGLDPADVRRRMADAVESWNERTDADRARRLYFVFHCGLVNMGEDRHRWHFWTVTPLWAHRVVEFAYGHIEAEAVGYPFFVEVLRRVYPKSLEPPLHLNPTRLASRWQVFAYSVKEEFLARLRNTRDYRRLRLALVPRERWATLATPDRFAWYREQFDSAFHESEAVRSVFDESAVRAWVHPGQATLRLDQLLTSVYFLAELGWRFPNVTVGA